jgi:hypothetical protein
MGICIAGVLGREEGIWAGLRLTSGHRQAAWKSPMIRLSPFRLHLFGAGYRSCLVGFVPGNVTPG